MRFTQSQVFKPTSDSYTPDENCQVDITYRDIFVVFNLPSTKYLGLFLESGGYGRSDGGGGVIVPFVVKS